MAKKSPREKLRDRIAYLGSDKPGDRNNAREKILDFLKEHGHTLAQLSSLSVFDMLSIEDETAREEMRQRILAGLKARGETWNHLAEITAAQYEALVAPKPQGDPRDTAPAGPVGRGITVLDLVRNRAEDYFVLETVHEYVAFVLWAVHTHVYELYEVTPRLVFTSPHSGHGKSVGLKVLDRLVVRPKKSDSFTAAAMYDAAHNERSTLLADEADNYDFATQGALRAIFNSGYAKNGTFDRGVGKQKITYRTFVPLAMASIGVLTPPGTLPPPLMRRSIIILMKKRKPKKRFVAGHTPDLDHVYQNILKFAREAKLNINPELPDELESGDATSVADNWRPLISIADAVSPGWGKLAREAALFFLRSGRHEDPVVTLLRDIRTVFDTLETDRVFINFKIKAGDKNSVSVAMQRLSLLHALHDMESGHWSEFCGARRNRLPHKLTEGELRAMLSPHGIVTRSVWSVGPRKPGDSSAKGYLRSDFEGAWKDYLGGEDGTSADGTAAQAAPPLRLA